MTATVSQPVQTSPVTENVMENGTHKSNNVLASQDVGLIFVREYYTFLNKSPHRLHGFYSEDSFMVRGDEGEVVETICGQEVMTQFWKTMQDLSHLITISGLQEIRKKIKEMDFQDCRVLVTQVDSQISANNGILVQVLGEMCNRDAPLQKFSQTFFLAPQPNGYYVLNDIFRFLKDEVNIDYYTCEEQDKQQQQHTEEQQPQQETNNVEAKASAAPATPPEVPAHETVELDSTAATAATTPTVGPAVVAEPPVHPSPETPAVEPEKKVDAKAKQEPEPAKDMEENVKPSEQPKQIKTDKKEPAAPKTWSNIAAGTTTSSNKWNNPLSGSSSPTTPTVSENKENIHSQPQLKHQKNNHQQSSQHQTHGNGYNHYNRDTARKGKMKNNVCIRTMWIDPAK